MQGINTAYPDVRPLVSPDGNSLYFSRQVKEGSLKKEADQDIYVVRKDPASGNWGKAEQLPGHLNNKRSDAVVSISPNGDELILFDTYTKTENAPLMRIVKEGDKWSRPEEIIITGYQNFSPYVNFFLDYRQKVLLLVIKPSSDKGE